MELEVCLHMFLTLVLDEERCSASCPSHSPPPPARERDLSNHWKGNWNWL